MTIVKWLILAGCGGLGACAGTPQRSVTAETWQYEVDAGKVGTIDRWALDHGATVIWLKYPQKTRPGDGS